MHLAKSSVLMMVCLVVGCGGAAPASNDGGSTAVSVITKITINPSSTNLQVTDATVLIATVYDQFDHIMGSTVNWQIVADDGTLSIIAAGVTCSVTGELEGTAQVRCFNGSVGGTCDVTVTAAPPPPPVITGPSFNLPPATEGYDYGPIQWTCTGGQGAKTWSVVSGALPGGLTLDEAGKLGGYPYDGTGGNTYTFTVQVSDESGSATSDHQLYVEYGGIVIIFD